MKTTLDSGRRNPRKSAILIAILAFAAISPAGHAQEPGKSDPTDATDSASMPSPDQFRVFTKDISPGNRLILIGVRNPARSKLGASTPKQMGFLGDGNDDADFEPKFVVSASDQGVHKIYAFEMGAKNDEDKGALPKELYDVDKQFSESLGAEKISTGMKVAETVKNVTGLSLAAKLWGHIGNRGEKERKRQANYLAYVLENALDGEQNKFPALRQALNFGKISGDERLKRMGSGLITRFHPRGNLDALLNKAPVLTTTEGIRKEELFPRYAAQHKDESEQQGGALDDRANANDGLVVVPMSSYFSLLEFDCKAPHDAKFWQKTQLGLKYNSQQIYDHVKDYCRDGNDKVPLGVYGLDSGKSFVKLVDFMNPDSRRNAELINDLRDLGQAATTTALPVTGQAVNWGGKVADFLIQRTGSDRNAYVQPSYQELRAAAETGSLDVDTNGMMKEVLLDSLKKVNGLSADQRKFYENGLSSKDPATYNQAFQGLVGLLAEKNSGVRGFSGGDKGREKYDQKRAQGWDNFSRWLGSSENSDKLSKENADEDRKQAEYNAQSALKAAAKKSRNDAKAAAREKQRLEKFGDATQVCKKPGSTAIIFGVDGLRPDRAEAAGKDPTHYPNFAKLLGSSVKFDSFDGSSTVSTAAWSEGITGMESSSNGIRGSAEASHDPKQNDVNQLDIRTSGKTGTFGALQKKEGSLPYQEQKRLGVKQLQDYFSKDEVMLSMSPIHPGVNPPYAGMKNQALRALQALGFGVLDGANILDQSTGQETANHILNNPGQTRLVFDWFGSADHDSHTGPNDFDDSLRSVDDGIGRVLAAAQKDPCLRNARIFLVSDHGLAGGNIDPNDPMNKELGAKSAKSVDNTGFNLAKYFTGKMTDSSRDYHFTVGSHKPCDTLFAKPFPFSLRDGILAPKSYTCRSELKSENEKSGYPHNRNMLVEPYGDRQAQVYLLQDPKNPTKRANYYDVTHYKDPATGKALDMPKDLLDAKLRNLDVKRDKDVYNAIMKRSDGHPVGYYAMALPDDSARASADALGLGSAAKTDPSALREPVLVRGVDGRASMILTRDVGGKTEYRYMVFKPGTFSQDANGVVHGDPSTDAADDPLRLGKLSASSADWMSDRDWLKQTYQSENPTALMSLPQELTLSPALAKDAKQRAELPDFLVVANRGFHFNPYQFHEEDHGGFSQEEARNTFYVTCASGRAPASAQAPIFFRDLAPTVLDAMGDGAKAKDMQGISQMSQVDQACGGAVSDPSVSGSSSKGADGVSGVSGSAEPAKAAK